MYLKVEFARQLIQEDEQGDKEIAGVLHDQFLVLNILHELLEVVNRGVSNLVIAAVELLSELLLQVVLEEVVEADVFSSGVLSKSADEQHTQLVVLILGDLSAHGELVPQRADDSPDHHHHVAFDVIVRLPAGRLEFFRQVLSLIKVSAIFKPFFY